MKPTAKLAAVVFLVVGVASSLALTVTKSLYGYQDIELRNGALVSNLSIDGAFTNTVDCGSGIGIHDCTFEAGTLNAATQFVLAAGHVFTRHTIITGVLSPVAVAANTCAAQSLTVPGLNAGDIVINGASVKPAFQAGLSVAGALVTGANTVSLNFCNNTAGPITPTATETYQFDVEQ